MTFQRAKTAEQRQIRTQEIIDAASALYDTIGYDKVTFSKIAQKVNFTRITLYHYFTCKEDIFLLLLEQDIASYVKDAKTQLTTPAKSIEEFIEKWTALKLRHQQMMALFSILNTIILRGATPSSHEAFRQHMFALFVDLSHVLEIFFPLLPKNRVLDFLDAENSYTMSIYPASIEYKTDQNIPIFLQAGYGTHPFNEQYGHYLRLILQGFLHV